MARNRKGPPDQAKHFEHDDHAHAAHQQEASHGDAQKPRTGTSEDGDTPGGKTVHPAESTPRSPSKGQ